MLHTLLDASNDMDILALIRGASLTVKGVIVLLLAMSATSWYIIGAKLLYLARARSRSGAFLDAFWKTARLDYVWKLTEEQGPSPVSEVFRAGYAELAKLRKRRAEQGQESFVQNETSLGELESGGRESG